MAVKIFCLFLAVQSCVSLFRHQAFAFASTNYCSYDAGQETLTAANLSPQEASAAINDCNWGAAQAISVTPSTTNTYLEVIGGTMENKVSIEYALVSTSPTTIIIRGVTVGGAANTHGITIGFVPSNSRVTIEGCSFVADFTSAAESRYSLLFAADLSAPVMDSVTINIVFNQFNLVADGGAETVAMDLHAIDVGESFKTRGLALSVRDNSFSVSQITNAHFVGLHVAPSAACNMKLRFEDNGLAYNGVNYPFPDEGPRTSTSYGLYASRLEVLATPASDIAAVTDTVAQATYCKCVYHVAGNAMSNILFPVFLSETDGGDIFMFSNTFDGAGRVYITFLKPDKYPITTDVTYNSLPNSVGEFAFYLEYGSALPTLSPIVFTGNNITTQRTDATTAFLLKIGDISSSTLTAHSGLALRMDANTFEARSATASAVGKLFVFAPLAGLTQFGDQSIYLCNNRVAIGGGVGSQDFIFVDSDSFVTVATFGSLEKNLKLSSDCPVNVVTRTPIRWFRPRERFECAVSLSAEQCGCEKKHHFALAWSDLLSIQPQVVRLAPLDCSELTDSPSCGGLAKCVWDSTDGKCVRKPCTWPYQSACEAETDSVGDPQCEWGIASFTELPTRKCRRMCSLTHGDSASCNGDSGCIWDYTAEVCTTRKCPDAILPPAAPYSCDLTECFALEDGRCMTKCGHYISNIVCQSVSTCQWSGDVTECVTRCDLISGAAACKSQTYCLWAGRGCITKCDSAINYNDCLALSTGCLWDSGACRALCPFQSDCSNAAQCELDTDNNCNDIPCAHPEGTSCELNPRCDWDNGMCKATSCNHFDQSACESANCRWFQSNIGFVCGPSACRGLDPDTCALSPICEFDNPLCRDRQCFYSDAASCNFDFTCSWDAVGLLCNVKS